MAVSFAREPLTPALWSEAFPLLVQHWKEVAHFPDIPLEPDIERYHSFDASGLLRVFTARDGEQYATFDGTPVTVLAIGGKLARVCDPANGERTVQAADVTIGKSRLLGYALYIVNTNPHYASSLQAVQDVIYVDPAARGGTGYRFIAWCDGELAKEGVDVVMHHVKAKPGLNFGALLERQNYALVDLIYAKRLSVPVDRPSVNETLESAWFV